MNVRGLLVYVVFGMAVLFPRSLYSQTTLDVQAWNLVWDRFDKIFPKGNDTNIIHALELPVPATWAAGNDDESLQDLQHLAGAIPDINYVLDPSRMQMTLQDKYLAIMFAVEIPNQSPEQKQRFQDASDRFNVARKAYEARLKEWSDLWKAEKTDLKADGKPIDAFARQQFELMHTGYFNDVRARMTNAVADIQSSAPRSELLLNAIEDLRSQYEYARGNGTWRYSGGVPTLKTIAADCPLESEKGWEKLSFTSSTTSQQTRSSAWNGNGGWGGNFFSLNLSAAGNNYSNVVTTADQSVSLKFCKMSPIAIYAGTWFHVNFLQAIDRGDYKLNQAKLPADMRGKHILGPDGMIPRLVKGAIVARNISFEAKLGTTNLDEVKSHIDGGVGLRIGPWNIGGGGGQDQYSRTYTGKDGSYGRATDFTVPALIAIITEPTSDDPSTPKP